MMILFRNDERMPYLGPIGVSEGAFEAPNGAGSDRNLRFGTALVTMAQNRLATRSSYCNMIIVLRKTIIVLQNDPPTPILVRF